MTQTYFGVLTAIGEAKDAQAKALGVPLVFTHMAVGDANGVLPVPDRSRTALIHENRRAPLNQLSRDPVNTSQVIAEQVIPESVGGWWIRELGLYDADGDLIAYANCPETYKPQLAEGSGRTQVVRMVLLISSADTVQLKVDPSIVLATRKYADDAITVSMNTHLAAVDPHPQYVTNAEMAAAISQLVNSSPAALDTLKELATALGNDPNFATTVTNSLAAKAPLANLHWLAQPIGVPIAIESHLAGIELPPTDNAAFRYIKLSAGDAYNTGCLTGESVTGSAPSIVATAVISLAGSPINGTTIYLENTMRTFTRAGQSGTLQEDAMQGHKHSITAGFSSNADGTSGSRFATGDSATSGPTTGIGGPTDDGTNGVPRVDIETRPRNIGKTMYMRIK